MIQVTIKHDKRGWDYFRSSREDRGRVRVGALNLSTRLWMQLALYAIKVIRERVTAGIGSNDQPMKPLSGRTSAIKLAGKFVRQRAGYADWKRARGLQSIRDLYGPGKDLKGNAGTHMLDDVRVTAVDETSAKIDITKRDSRTKARANEARSPWIGFSPNDRQKIMVEFRRLFGVECHDATDVFAALGVIASKRFGSALRRVA